jgi:hypothetical protein
MAMLGPGRTLDPGGGPVTTDMGFRTFRKINKEVFTRRVMRGIPDGCRSRAWQLIIDPKSADNEPRKKVSDFLDRGVPPTDEAIQLDIPRTIEYVALSSKTKSIIQGPLYRILRAYAISNKALGYVQGMAVYAALLVGYMDEDQAFWTFQHLLHGTKHLLADFFMENFLNLRFLNVVWNKVLQIEFPKVYANFTRLKVDPMIYTPNWFLTAFQVLGFPDALRLRIFDGYAAFGTRALLSFAVLITKRIKIDLEVGNASTVPLLLQDPSTHRRLRNWRQLLQKWDKSFMTKTKYKSYFKEAKVRYFR